MPWNCSPLSNISCNQSRRTSGERVRRTRFLVGICHCARSRSSFNTSLVSISLGKWHAALTYPSAHYGDEVYDLLSASFDDPSATIVYPYVYRILNSATKAPPEAVPTRRNGASEEPVPTRPFSEASSRSSRPISPHGTSSSAASHLQSSPSRRTSPLELNGNDAYPSTGEEPDPDAQLLRIIGHISSETTGALHKEGITELHHFLKAYPHKRQRVEKMLESTGAAFRKYINRALASRAAEDQERNVAVADTLSSPWISTMLYRQFADLWTELESNKQPDTPTSPTFRADALSRSPRQKPLSTAAETEEKLSRLHNLFQYRSSTGSSHGRTTPSVPPSSTSRV
jgi:cytoskeleton-associated protein 5